MKIIISVLLSCIMLTSNAQVKTQNAFQEKVIILKTFLDKHHYSPRIWNDSSSAMLYDHFLKELDDEKIYFNQQDIDVLSLYRQQLDEELKNGKGSFFETVLKIYSKRLLEADSSMRSFLAKPADYTKPDQLIRPFTGYAVTASAINIRRQQFLKHQILEDICDELNDDDSLLSASIPANFAMLEQTARSKQSKKLLAFSKMISVNPNAIREELENNFLNAIAWTYDPHSNYMDFREKEEFNAEVSAKEFSAGLSVAENDKGDKVIDYLQPGGSAWRSGRLNKGDVVQKIKMGNIEKDATDMTAEDLTAHLNSTSGGDIDMTVKTAAGTIKTVTLVQETVSADDSKVKSYVVKGASNIGYINLPGFYSREEEGQEEIKYDGCANDVSREIMKLKKDNIAALILDLRNNGGGSMWEAMQLAGIFIDAGPVASVKDKDGKVQFMKDPNRGTIYDGPLVILINGLSASASEFLSAALQDYNRAVIVGGTTYGKGTAQDVLPMDTNKVNTKNNYRDFVKVTEMKFYRVNGSTVQWKGVEPDIALPDLYSELGFKEKLNESALLPDMSRAAKFEILPALPVAELRAKSEARIKPDAYFNYVSAYTAKRADKNPKTIPLNWKGYVGYYQNKAADIMPVDKNKVVNTVSLKVENNSFDKERILLSSAKLKEANKKLLEYMSADHELNEACNIIHDWIKMK